MKNSKVVKGVWYEVCVSQSGEVRDIDVEATLDAAKRRRDIFAEQWPNCEMVFVRQHRADPQNGPGASKFVVLHKMTLDFRGPKS